MRHSRPFTAVLILATSSLLPAQEPLSITHSAEAPPSVSVANLPVPGIDDPALNKPNDTPQITVQPQSHTVEPGMPMVLQVEARGAMPLVYQWSKDGAFIPSATNATYALPVLQKTDGGNYVVVITNHLGSATSTVATLTVDLTSTLPQIQISKETNQLALSYFAGDALGFFSILEAGDMADFPNNSQVIRQGAITPGQTGRLAITNPASPETRFYLLAISPLMTNPAPERLAWVAPGFFEIGSSATDPDAESDEMPQMGITVKRGFWLDKFEVTQGQYQEIMGTNPSYFTGDPNRPVEQVSWEEATNYCAKLTEREQQAGHLPEGYVYRLPTEAEWEYAARAGTSTRFSFGDDLDYQQLGNYAWFKANSADQTHPVGAKLAEASGFYDLQGNVAEWCWDWYGPYIGGTLTNPQGPSSGSEHVIRGGSYADEGEFCRTAFRLVDWTTHRFANVGFRVALAPALTPPQADPIQLAWIPPGEFLMGSPDSEMDRETDEGPQMLVRINQGFFMGKFEITQAQYEEVIGTNNSYWQGYPNRPVDQVTWEKATNFCQRLTDRELKAVRLPAGYVYRLPTEAEWEYAARGGATNRFNFGDDPGYVMLIDYANYQAGPTLGAGAKNPNSWGLHDMMGNVWEWCADWYGTYQGGSVIDPAGPAMGSFRVNRGGSYDDAGSYCRSAQRNFDWPLDRFGCVGFRVVLAPPIKVPGYSPPEMALIPAGTFTMGSPDTDPEVEMDEQAQHRVTLSKPFWMGKFEVTQGQYLSLMNTNPSFNQGGFNLPVEQVTWDDATNYCARLTERERQAGRLPGGYVYRLPTEAEWEYATRAGTTNRFFYGDDLNYSQLGNYAWFMKNSRGTPHGVGAKAANPWGLHDLQGNVAEWCWDYYAFYRGDATDPQGPAIGDEHVFRGGSAFDAGEFCRTAFRQYDWLGEVFYNVGFRVVLGPELKTAGQAN